MHQMLLVFIIFVFGLQVNVIVGLQYRYASFDICNKQKHTVELATCTPKPPCIYCISVLSENSVYRVSDVVRQRGFKWKHDARTIIGNPSDYNSTYLYKVLDKTTSLAEGKDRTFSPYRAQIDVYKELVLAEEGQCKQEASQYNDKILFYLRMGDKHVVHQNTLTRVIKEAKAKKVKTVVLSFVLHYGQFTKEEVTLFPHMDERFHMTNTSLHQNYIHMFEMVQKIKFQLKESKVEVELRSNADQDYDMCLYAHVKNMLVCNAVKDGKCGGFEELVAAMRPPFPELSGGLGPNVLEVMKQKHLTVETYDGIMSF